MPADFVCHGKPVVFLAPTIFVIVNITVLAIATATILRLLQGRLFERKRAEVWSDLVPRDKQSGAVE